MHEPTAGTRAGRADVGQQAVVAAAAGDRTRRPELRRDQLEHEAGVVLEIAAELGGELGVVEIDAGLAQQVETAAEGIEPAGEIELAAAHQVFDVAGRSLGRPLHGDVALDQRRACLLGERRLARVGRVREQPLGDLGQRARADQLDAGLVEVVADDVGGIAGVGRIELVGERGRQACAAARPSR